MSKRGQKRQSTATHTSDAHAVPITKAAEILAMSVTAFKQCVARGDLPPPVIASAGETGKRRLLRWSRKQLLDIAEGRGNQRDVHSEVA
jgi:hypothetical protein